MRSTEVISAELKEARKVMAGLRKEMLDGIKEACEKCDGKIEFGAVTCLLDKGKFNESQVLSVYPKGEHIGYKSVSLDKTTPLYQYCGRNSIQEYHLDNESLSYILAVYEGVEQHLEIVGRK